MVFLRRLGSTVVLWAVVLWAIFSNNHRVTDWVFLAIVLVLGWLGQREFHGLVEQRGLASFRGWGLAMGAGMIGASFLYFAGHLPGDELETGRSGDIDFVLITVVLLGLCVRRFMARELTDGFVAIATTLLGVLYVPWLLTFLFRIVFFPGIDGRLALLLFILVTKMSDLGAYVTGSLIGRHKMIPRISPGKTWEGLGGAVVFSTLASIVFARYWGESLAGLTMGEAAVLGIVLSLAAVLGDLIESLFKREAGVKDSGRLFPGIGGVLDLLDSLLFNAPLMYLYLWFVLS
jgi:phosphatidate cytidylyltransferase